MHEHYRDARFGHDYVRCLEARVSYEGFVAFARRLELDQQYPADKPDRLELILGLGAMRRGGTHHRPWKGRLFERGLCEAGGAVAKYHNGYVYFVAWCF